MFLIKKRVILVLSMKFPNENFSSPSPHKDTPPEPSDSRDNLQHFVDQTVHDEENRKIVGEYLDVKVSDDESLESPEVINRLYTAAMDDLLIGSQYKLELMMDKDFIFAKKGLLVKEDITKRGVTEEMKSSAMLLLLIA